MDDKSLERPQLPSTEVLELSESQKKLLGGLQKASDLTNDLPIEGRVAIGNVLRFHEGTGVLDGATSLSSYLQTQDERVASDEIRVLLEILNARELDLLSKTAPEIVAEIPRIRALEGYHGDSGVYMKKFPQVSYESGKSFFLSLPTKIKNVRYEINISGGEHDVTSRDEAFSIKR